jgi:hypothetical protein
MLITIFIAAAVFLIVWNIRRVYGFESDYKYTGSFAGKRYECAVGGLSEERDALCFMGADESGLYLLPHPKKLRWFSGYRGVFKKSLFIPWTDVAYRPGKALLKECLWFDLSARRVYFYIPKDVGEKLLNDAGRGMPL